MSVLRNARRGMSVIAGSVVLAVLGATGAAATTVLVENFETTPTLFTLYGTSTTQDCTTAAEGSCSIEAAPTGAGRTGAKLSSSFSMAGRTRITVKFMADSTVGDVDAEFVVALNGGGQVRLVLTEGVGTNNGVSLHSGASSDMSFTSWPAANTWYTAVLEFDTVIDRVTATVNGTMSAALPISSTATTVTELDANTIRWSSYGWPFHYDAIKVETCTLALGVCLY